MASAYYKLGLTYEALKQLDNARKAFDTVVQKFPARTMPSSRSRRSSASKRRDDQAP